ncbi:MAG: ATP-dependent Clp protease ATP-binding subunit [Acidobacteria bacterium]|jgi:ATP-dependent Clp protease ATP-binding subunit ClpC|nr:ATP-dependent Clp protease ATP-binding subunit [Acidobacteriota bacterium]
MDQLFSQYPRLGAFLAIFLPEFQLEKREFNKENADRLIACLVGVLDALFKAENLARRKNLRLAPGKTFFPDDMLLVLENVAAYLQTFNTQVLSMSKTERQTLVFILENVGDYLKNGRLQEAEKGKKNLFFDYKFWIENLFKLFDQKISGAVTASKRVTPKNLFGPQEALHDELIYGNATLSFSLFPFAVIQEGRVLFLAQLDETGARFRDGAGDSAPAFSADGLWQKVGEFLLANFAFADLERVECQLPGGEAGGLGRRRQVEAAQRDQQLKLFAESQLLLEEIAFEDLSMPLVYLLQIRNLAELGRGLEMKRLLQKFLLFYPFYAEGHELMGDVYAREENIELALNFYEKALLISQSKGLADKIKKARDFLEKGRGKPEAQKNDAFFDITDAVIQNEQRIIGRGKELRQMIEILISNSKRNLLLIGERGVGKSTLVRLLAQKIIFGEVPGALREKRIKEINFVALLTGSKYRGQFEEKVLKLLQEFKAQNAILVLEDMHLMMSTGAARGTSLDLVNILKNFLRDNSIQVIATTDYEEYKNTIEKDNSLLGYFQKIVVNELSAEGTRRILRDLVGQVVAADSLLVSSQIIEDIVESAKRDIRERKLPDAAIMLLERCIAKVKLKNSAGGGPLKIEEADVLEVLADIGNLPETNISISLKSRLGCLRANILKRIVGQDDAVAKMVSSVITSKLGYDVKKNRPDGVFMFIGPTGVGKTETAIALSEALYGSQDYLIRIDMSEYMEKFTYSRFVGAAPGYVGYYDANQLTDKVRLNPYSVILLDEIEKADAQLLNIFLQVFDAGRLTDARGNVIDFSKTTIVMTSNIGTSLFSKANMGYKSTSEETQVSRATLIKSLKKYFSPEFLNRIDEIVVFHHLRDGDIKAIIDIHLREVRRDLEKQGKELVVPEEVLAHIAARGYSLEYGARNLNRVLKKELLEKIAYLSLEKEWEEARYLACRLRDDEIEILPEPAAAALSAARELEEAKGE